MKFKEALEIIRKEFKTNCVVYGYDYDDSYGFLVSIDKKFNKEEPGYHCKVNKETGKIIYFYPIQEIEAYSRAIKKRIYVDVKEEDLK